MIPVLAGACVTPGSDYASLPEFLYLPVGAAQVTDRRQGFAGIFCTLLAADEVFSGAPCEDHLHLDGPGALRPDGLGGQRPAKRRYLIVPGYGAECFAEIATPFQGALEVLQAQGVDAELLMVPGRASTADNATFIARALRSAPRDDAAEVVLIGYSKGLADILEAVVEYPDALSRVVAVVGIAGVVNGSPIATDMPMSLRVLRRWFAGSCERNGGDEDAIRSIGYEHRQNWLSSHRLDPRILYFSLAAYTATDKISLGLRVSHRKLARIDPRNDGLMIYRDAIIPGSFLLGLLAADHWAVAMPFSESNVFVRTIIAGQNHFPRTVLLRSIVIAVERELDARLE